MLFHKNKRTACQFIPESSPFRSSQCKGFKSSYLTFSLRVLPALNLTTFDAGILSFSPVMGLRPSRLALPTTLKVPKPTSVILSPPDKAAETSETNPSTAFYACDLRIPPSLAIFATNSTFVILFPP